MCPLRFILVFFSAVLAGYLAWKTVSSSDEPNLTTPEEKSSTIEKQEFQSFNKFGIQIIENGFWVFIDMASGRYLWRNIKHFNSSPPEAKASS
ncbi:hypothetical protein DH2020_016789 [Rehmannia glutinosa]|uniref:Methyltransferase-like protein n=1 Tax=Rehmannia glutinosa TaxID=99300 RepID=A0ABR0WSI2_REHGL